MTNLFRAVSFVFAIFILMGAGEPPDASIVAQRGDVRLTGPELKDTLSLLDPTARGQVTGSPEALANFVRERLLNLAVLAEAKSKGWDTQADVVRRINEARDAVILQTYLASQVPPDPEFPTDVQVTAAYDANKAHLIAPRQVRLAQIVLAVKAGATPEEDEGVHRKAIELRALASKPKADFAELAKKNSQEAQSAEKGGDVGWLREPDMAPQVREAVGLLADNGISPPIRMPDGWHILKVLEVKPGGPVSLQDARPQIIQALRQARGQRLMRAYLDQMVKDQPIQVNEIELTRQIGTGK